jgi:hypothetical protein
MTLGDLSCEREESEGGNLFRARAAGEMLHVTFGGRRCQQRQLGSFGKVIIPVDNTQPFFFLFFEVNVTNM